MGGGHLSYHGKNLPGYTFFLQFPKRTLCLSAGPPTIRKDLLEIQIFLPISGTKFNRPGAIEAYDGIPTKPGKLSGPSGESMNRAQPDPGDARAVSWVSTEWLMDHLHDTGLIVLDVRPDSHVYFFGHIPGALWLHDAHLRSHIGTNPVRWIGPEAVDTLFSTLGIDTDVPVVVYSGNCGPDMLYGGSSYGLEQYLVAYSLVRFGCRRVFILDGGLNRWMVENRPVEQKYGMARLSAFRAEVRTEYMVGMGECVRLKDNPGTVLLDTRPLAWYEGQGPWMRPGHIPGAVSLPFANLLDPENPALILTEPELREVFSSRGATPDKTIICSCGTGRTAVIAFLILKWFLGYPEVVMFEGGFTEWISRPDAPVVVGKSAR
jgi:thiosulfate/3-mercaptopyruvate sulfurtransferase